MDSVSREVYSMGKPKVPHMLYEQLHWIKKAPPKHITCMLSVSIIVDAGC